MPDKIDIAELEDSLRTEFDNRTDAEHDTIINAARAYIDLVKLRPIEELQVTDRTMFVVIALNVKNGFTLGKEYTSDPYCVWKEDDGSFARWPHHFAPTHFYLLPPTGEKK